MAEEFEKLLTSDTNTDLAALKHSMRTQWIMLTIAMTILATFIGYYGFIDHRNITDQERHRLKTQAGVITLNMEQQLEATDRAMISVVNDIAYLRKHEDLKLTNRRLQALTDAMPGVRTMMVLDSAGIVAASNRDELIGKDFSSRDDYTTPVEDNDASTLYVSPPFETVLGTYAINVSRIIPSETGKIYGIVSATLDPQYFKVLLTSVLYAPDMLSTIIHGDGIRFMMVPDSEGQAGRDLTQFGTFFSRHLKSGKRENVLIGTSPSYSSERVIALHTVEPKQLQLDKPLYVACSRDNSTIHKEWRNNTLKQVVTFAIISIVAIFGLVLLQRRQKELALHSAQAHELINLRLGLMELVITNDMHALLRQAVDNICRLSASPLGFFYFVETDQKTLSLQAWSSNTLNGADDERFQIGQESKWADCIRQRRPVVYKAGDLLEGKNGLPAGHGPILREMVVPVFRGNAAVAFLVICNKADGYSDQDIDFANRLADILWEITERKQLEMSLRESKQLLADIFDFLPDATFVVDQEKKVIAWNRAMEELSSIPKEEMLGQDDHAYSILLDNQLFDLIDADDDAINSGFQGVTRCGERLSGETFCPGLNNGKGGHVWAVVAPLYDYDGRRTGAIQSIRDITAIKETEINLARSNSELEQFAYVASHDLQEPLRKIAGFTELLASRYKGTLDAKADSYMEYIVDGATRMRTLINDLLSYSRIMRSKRELAETPCSVVITKVLRDMELVLKENDAEVICGPLPVIKIDPSQIGQLFQNLIGNALKYRTAAAPRITINAARQRNHWLFSVADNGIGIAPEYYERIFAIFQRLHTRAEYPGTGIGLAVCQKIVERHGGKIWVESVPDSGSTFFFTMPATPHDREMIS